MDIDTECSTVIGQKNICCANNTSGADDEEDQQIRDRKGWMQHLWKVGWKNQLQNWITDILEQNAE